MTLKKQGDDDNMDAVDGKILKILSENAAATATEIGEAVNLSIPAVNKRILKLRECGIIRSYTILTDEKKVGKSICAFILLAVRYGEGIDVLQRYVNEDADVLECYAVTGDYDYLIKICAESIEVLEEKLLFMKKQKGVMKSHTMFSLREHKMSATVLPNFTE